VSRIPNFFLAGVPNAGTTSLHTYLAQHPSIYMSPIKEPTFFGASDALVGYHGPDIQRQVERDHQAVRRYLGRNAAGNAALTWREYLDLFAGADAQPILGESTVRYYWLANSAREMRARIPDARIVFVLRDPVERAFSRFLTAWWQGAPRSFAEWLERAPGSPWEPIVDGGRYATHLSRFLAAFPRDQIRIVLYDQYRSDPRAVLEGIFAFLGIAPRVPIDISRRKNVHVVPRFRGLESLRRRVHAPPWLPDWARRTAHRVYHRRRAERAMTHAERSVGLAFYRDEIVKTAALIGVDLEGWL